MSGLPAPLRPWLAALGACAALLIVPMLAWILVPSVRPYTPRPAAAASSASPEDTTATEADERPALARPRTVPTWSGDDDEDEPTARPAAPEVPEVPVRGLVVDAEGSPVAGASVRCTDREIPPAVSGPDGRFELSGDAEGCSAVAQHSVKSPSARVTLAATDNNRLALGRAGGISGVVVDERGKGVAGYVIAIESFVPAAGEGPGPNGAPKRVDEASGAFEWSELPAGRYVLTASADARPPARSDAIEVQAGTTTSHVRLVLSRGASLSGVVTDADTRRPVAGATVVLDTATTSGANSIGSVTTDAAGAFTLAGVPAKGPFSVRVTHGTYRTKIVSGLDARGSATLQERIALKARGDGGGESELAGIGAYLVPGRGGVIVAGTVAGGPAERAGLKRNDRIERIDGDDARVLPLVDCVQRLRGPDGSRLALQVDRGGKIVNVAIVREIVVR